MRCVICSNWFHPDFGEPIENSNPPASKCLFCKLGTDKLTVVDDETGKERVITKKEASEKYMRWLNKLASSPKIKEIINKSGVDVIKDKI